MDDINGDFLESWREKYRWPFYFSRAASEEKILSLENLVINNILRSGLWSVKDVLLEIVNWKTGGQQTWRFYANDANAITNAVNSTAQILRANPDDVSGCINVFSPLRGVGIPVASAFLRFLDPIEHKYGIIDKNVASFLNSKEITSFRFDEQGYLILLPSNVDEYQKYHMWLQQKVREINGSGFTYRDINGIERRFTAVDIDMALFAYSFANRESLSAVISHARELGESERAEEMQISSEVDLDSEDSEYSCPYCEASFSSQDELEEHVNSHGEELLPDGYEDIGDGDYDSDEPS